MARQRLPETRDSVTKKGSVSNYEFYVIVGFYDAEGEQTKPGEVFIEIAKEGSILGGMADVLGLTISIALQHGAEWEKLRDKYRYVRFEPMDDKYSSLADAIADAIDDCIEHRRKRTGFYDNPRDDTTSDPEW